MRASRAVVARFEKGWEEEEEAKEERGLRRRAEEERNEMRRKSDCVQHTKGKVWSIPSQHGILKFPEEKEEGRKLDCDE